MTADRVVLFCQRCDRLLKANFLSELCGTCTRAQDQRQGVRR